MEQNREFQYHFRCKRLKITNVCFADDLLVFCHANRTSISFLKESIEEFGKVAGLMPNYKKSTIIFGSLSEEEKQDILEIVPFKVEKLLIRYHGRLMLVASVLEAIHVDWASVFLLPIGVSGDINKLLKNFLWNQSEGTKGSFKVPWKNVCKAKQKGGLGLKNLRERNRRIFKYERRSIEELFGIFNETVRLRLLSLNVKDSIAARKAQEVLDVKICIKKIDKLEKVDTRCEDHAATF
ncbi:hypothetical protein Tco_1189369 [Tanacetum coccineum]